MARSLRGSGLLLVVQVLQNFVRLSSNLLLVRLVAPEAFGLFGIALTFSQAATMFTDIGIVRSVVRSDRGEIPAYRNTAFVTNLVLNAGLWLAVVLAAVFVAANQALFPEESILRLDQAAPLIAFAGMQLLLVGFTSPKLWMAQRNLHIGRIVTIEVASQLIALVLTLVLAWLGFGAWALASGAVMSRLILVAGSHQYLPGDQVRLEWDRDHFKEIFDFGKWLVPASISGFFLNQGDKFLLGIWMTGKDFSIYIIALTWATAAFSLIQRALNQIAFSALSEALRSNRAAATDFYERYRLIVDACCVGLFVAFNVAIVIIINLLYPEVYKGAILYAQILSLFILTMPFRLVDTVVLSSGDSRSFSNMLLISVIAVVGAAFALNALFGPVAAIFAFAFKGVVVVPQAWRLARRSIDLKPLTELRIFVPIALAIAWIATRL